ncbi:MAG: dienelactone hydrolase family protein [Proteobacteria bacterium]|nr:dienelactone hydrolase family protein [Pseudomonadota bacterium]
MNTSAASTSERDVFITADTLRLPGQLNVPPSANGVVLFAHGSGSSRSSPRNRRAAEFFDSHGIGTLLFDLLSEDENDADAVTREYRFDIPLLAGRLVRAVEYVRNDADTQNLPLGLFGASTGAAAALIAAAERPDAVHAVVSRGGRSDLAGDALENVRAPTLLIVGENDPEVIDLNRRAATRLNAMHRTVIVEGASHLFEEPGTLGTVQELAADWFTRWFDAPQGTLQ